ncbi:class I SAM-dependent methyltransferase [Glaciibacter flavus]|uniref:class I SAM-dependent methyltransferase n=1 Tax=Orlajensenia flava TaxID=2565934 RepID=UPI003B00FE4F
MIPGSDADVRAAYAARAAEYVSVIGSVELNDERDRELIARWGRTRSGHVIDAGCGPGHWTDLLHREGCDVEGFDLVAPFIDQARVRFPRVTFRVGSIDDLGDADGQADGILSWYSLIHADPERVPTMLAEFARCLRPGGSLLLGFFDGERVEPFPHRVSPAWFWPVDEMALRLVEAGFTVEEMHTRVDPGHRPHAAIVAQRTGSSLDL